MASRATNVGRASWLNNFNNNSNFNANDRNVNNHNRLRGIAQNTAETTSSSSSCKKIPRDVWQELCSYYNLELAFKKARKGKTLKPYVIEFEQNLKENLFLLRTELILHSYRPKPLQTFILHDPKTRKISKSHFRDRIIHHALCNIIEPLFEKRFIFDSYANRKEKGTLKALERFNFFKRKVTHNNTRTVYVLKADIKHYFETVNHGILMSVLSQKIKDQRILWLVKIILRNYTQQEKGKGMPLGNLTSQFFANVYLNELDQYVKQKLKIKYYLRYVDDFVIFGIQKQLLKDYQQKITLFLKEALVLELHPDKSRIIAIKKGVEFLGLKIFPHHRLIKRKNIRKFYRKLQNQCIEYDQNMITYDTIYDFLEGWIAYAKNANTYTRRTRIMASLQERFLHEISTKEMNRYSKALNKTKLL